MLSAKIVAMYLVLWLTLRLSALRFSKPARRTRRSPWFTRGILIYCFALCVTFIIRSIWTEGGNIDGSFDRTAAGTLLVAIALAADAISLFTLCPFYSLEMEAKENHLVVRNRLYRFVRHPIYSSNIIGFFGLCILMNDWAAWLAAPGQALGFYLMARDEEQFLIAQVGKEYKRYRGDVQWMLIPGII